MILSLTIDRTSLSLPALVISNNPFGATFWLPEDGMSEPNGDLRRTYMPDSQYAHGRELLGVSRAAADIAATIYAQGVDMAALTAAKTELEAALMQWDYDLTQNIDGAVTTYRAEPVLPTWGGVDSGMVRSRIARTSVVIPLHPVAVA